MTISNSNTRALVESTIVRDSIRSVGEIAHDALARGLALLPRLRARSSTTATESSHGMLLKRHLAGGAIAGVTVGVVVAVALLAFCSYPFCVQRLKRRRHANKEAFDPEAAMAEGPGDTPSAPAGPHRRLSSSDSLKQNGNLTRGQLGEGGTKELDWGASPDGNNLTYPNGTFSQLGGTELALGAGDEEHGIRAAPFPLLGCYDGEFAPRISEDHQPGVLKGTSADYYSPDIPSEAFGMVTDPEPAFDAPLRTSSYGSSVRRNMWSMFRRKTKDGTMSSTASQPTGEKSLPSAAVPHLTGTTAIQPIVTSSDRVESPVDISPTTETGQETASPPTGSEPEKAVKTPPESPFPPYQQFRKSASPPAHAAPGTVNPMDIMPASTESEMWHRTEHQLFISSNESSPCKLENSPEQEAVNLANIPSPSPTPPESHVQPVFAIQSPDPEIGHVDFAAESHPIKMDEDSIHVDQSLHPETLAPTENRHPSYPSDQSTPFPTATFTDVSSLNTPSTQLDSPSPRSVGSSDFRHSASPHSGAGGHSPRIGTYRCDEPGCSQSFDQPHKLKHHQRYHSKDHKCTYPGCGKGFGTKTHLQRHINDRHEKKKKFHCSVSGCDYSRTGGKAFPRKDNWKRHMTKIHNIDQQQLPEPIEVDLEMGGT